jgi:addiction module RelE/StbE family toxin
LYDIAVTRQFEQDLKPFRRHRGMLAALEKKLERLRNDPHAVGKPLRGTLHGYYATRMLQDFRLLFTINDETRLVMLETLDHRKDVYK